MIRVDIVNDGTGTAERGNYDVEVYMPGNIITTRVENFNRRTGWLSLCACAIAAAHEADLEERFEV